MKLKYSIDDRMPFGQMMLYAMQWFILAVAVVATSVWVAPIEERLFFSQKMFALMGITGLLQVIIGHRMPLVTGPAAVLLVGVMASKGAPAAAIYSAIAVGGALITLLTFGRVMRYVQRLFTPRIVVVILMLIAFTLTPVIANNLVFSTQPTDSRLFGLIFAPVGCFAMVILNRTLKGVGKSLVIPIALVAGSVAYYLIYPTPEAAASNASLGGLFIEEFTFDWGLIIAFVICYIALLINDIGSIESLGTILQVDNMERRMRRGVRLTGVMNILAGAVGVLGPVNFSMSPGIIAATGCASRRALIPATLLLTLCALSPETIWVLINIPNPVIGVILLFLMGTQLAASFEMLHSTKAVQSFADGLTLGLPLMVAMLFTMMPKGIAPAVIEPLVGNGFAMGVIVVMIMEHVVNRPKRVK